MYTIVEAQERIAQAISSETFIQEPKNLYLPIDYALRQGGKRIRPVLTLLACDLFGGDLNKAIRPALGLEIFHNFTLLHDDIMDGSPLRRGKETVYKKWDVNTAILSGDTMYAMAYTYLMSVDSTVLGPVLETFNKTAIEVCEGQQMDMDFEQMDNVSINDYMAMIRLKTAVLLGCALKIGAIIANAPAEQQESLYNFGIHIGLAFQLQDDLLDCWSDVELFGKITGRDIIDNKKTFLCLKALEVANETQKKTLKHYLATQDVNNDEKVRNVREIYETLEIKNKTFAEMQMHHQKAIAFLESIPVASECKKALRELTDSLMNRKF